MINIGDLQKIKTPSTLNKGSVLQVGNFVKSTLLRIKNILEIEEKLNFEISNLMKELLARAYIIDKVFNPLEHKTDELFLGDFLVHSGPTDEKEENEIYYHTPSIGVFFEGKPIFLNHNYIEALGATDEETLKEDIIQGKALEKYYTYESALIAKEAVSKLQKGEGYENLILETKTGKKISWNSFGNVNGLEIRIGNDITLGKFKNTHMQGVEDFEGMKLDTLNLITTFVAKVQNTLEMEMDGYDKNTFVIFGFLSTILDRLWENGQFLMNMTINEDIDKEMLFNSNYSKALKRVKENIIQKNRNGTLWSDTYDEETMALIEGLMIVLKQEGYYISEFPMKDSEGKRKVYSWLRFLIQDKDFGIERTFGIGNDAISKDNAEITKFLQEHK